MQIQSSTASSQFEWNPPLRCFQQNQHTHDDPPTYTHTHILRYKCVQSLLGSFCLRAPNPSLSGKGHPKWEKCIRSMCGQKLLFIKYIHIEPRHFCLHLYFPVLRMNIYCGNKRFFLCLFLDFLTSTTIIIACSWISNYIHFYIRRLFHFTKSSPPIPLGQSSKSCSYTYKVYQFYIRSRVKKSIIFDLHN